jgi:hypothetical protein
MISSLLRTWMLEGDSYVPSMSYLIGNPYTFKVRPSFSQLSDFLGAELIFNTSRGLQMPLRVYFLFILSIQSVPSMFNE